MKRKYCYFHEDTKLKWGSHKRITNLGNKMFSIWYCPKCDFTAIKQWNEGEE